MEQNEKPRRIVYEGTIGGEYEIIYEPMEGHCPRCDTPFLMREDGTYIQCPNCGLIPQIKNK